MNFTFGTGIRIFTLTAALVLAAACGSTAKPQVHDQSTGANTIVATVPEPPAPSNAISVPSATPARSITISKVVWDDYQAYLTKVGRIGNGFYAVTEDGLGGASWACGEAFCGAGYDGESAAMKQCQSANTGKTCILFAKDDRIQMKYEIAQ